MYVYVYIYQLNRHHGKYDHVFHAFFWGGDCDVSWSMVILVMYASKVAPSVSGEPRVVWDGMQVLRTIGLAANGNTERINLLGYPPKKLWRQRFCWIFFCQVGSKFYIHVLGARRTPPFRPIFSRNVKPQEAEVASKRASQVFHAWLTQAIWDGEKGKR